MTTIDCAAHQCGECGRFVPKASVSHRFAFVGHEDTAGAFGNCAEHGPVDVHCVRVGKRSPS